MRKRSKFIRVRNELSFENIHQTRKSKVIKSLAYNRIFQSCVVGLLLLIFFHIPLFQAYGEWLSPIDTDLSADIVLSLGRGVNDNRFNAAYQIFQDKKVDKLYIDNLAKKEIEFLASKQSVSSEKFYWGGCFTPTTFDQVVAFQEAMKANNIKYSKIVIVSDKYHLRRVKWIFQHILGPNIEVKTSSTPSTDKFVDQIPWWHYDPSRDWVISETQKLIFYWIQYGFLGKKVGEDIQFTDVFRMKETSSATSIKSQIKRCRGESVRGT